MSDFLILILIVVLFLCLTVTLFGFVIYSGLLHHVDIKTGSPPVRNVTIAYKLNEAPSYSSSSSSSSPFTGASYAEATSIGPNLSSIGIFYDNDPKQKPGSERTCRYAVGSVLSEGDGQPDAELLKLYEQYGFKVFSLPEVTHAVTASFPYTTPVSHVLASYRVYPELQAYIQDRKLCAFPTIEICKADQTYYMVPLSRQTDFFVPEMRDEVKTELKEEDSDEDRGTDITGADSHSDGSSASGSGAPWDSRETSLAASTAASLASSLPLRDLGDGEEDHQRHDVHREPGGGDRGAGDRGSDESVGSGSSFEELDMIEPVDVEGPEEEEEEGGERGTEEEEGTPATTLTTDDEVIEPLVEQSSSAVERPRPPVGGEEK